MSENSVAGKYFEHLFAYALAVCKECKQGVLPSQVKSHLQRAHRVSRKQAESIAEDIASWAGLVEYASELEVPSQVIPAIQQLAVYVDGLMCQIDADYCRQIF
jgi:hypothetical protein